MVKPSERIKKTVQPIVRHLQGLPGNLESSRALTDLVSASNALGIKNPERTVLPHLLPMRFRLGLGRSMFRQFVLQKLARDEKLPGPLHLLALNHPDKLIAAQTELWWSVAEKKSGMSRGEMINRDPLSTLYGEKFQEAEVSRLGHVLELYANLHRGTSS